VLTFYGVFGVFYFFFFQAEDGIRDTSVTGVQTCALPILTVTSNVGYSQWFDLSFSSNKLRQSYLKGFLDISGGPVLMRSDNSLNF